MLPYRLEGEDYRPRIDVLQRNRILEVSHVKTGTPGRFLNRATFNEISFAAFVSWIYLAIRNRDKTTTRVNLVLMPAVEQRTLLTITKIDASGATPGRTTSGLWLDDEYLSCPVDQSGKPVERQQQILCPVLNRTRLNLSQALDSHEPPKSSKDCCASIKRVFWEYLHEGLDKDLSRAGAMIGGQVVPIALPSDLARAFSTGLEATSRDMAKVFEETLLVYALMASEVLLGAPHFTFTIPIETHEIDFALYDCPMGDKCAATDWHQKIGAHSTCVFELTAGHRPEVESRPPRVQEGTDHPKNKIVNFLALNSLGFAVLRYHYLSIVPPSNNISSATKQALTKTDGFQYWCLDDEFPGIETLVLGDGVIDVSKLRAWHDRIVAKVEEAAIAFRDEVAFHKTTSAKITSSAPFGPATPASP